MKKILIIMFTLTFIFSVACMGQPEDKNERSPEKNKGKEIITLPEAERKGEMSLEECIEKRRSTRRFTERNLTDEEISQILWAAQGITEKTKGYRASPSAGALYPLELYVVTEKGVYHYIPVNHALELHKQEDLRKHLSDAALSQDWVEEAPMDLVVTAIYRRVTRKYGNKGFRYTHMEAGHAAQNVHLQAVSLGLASVPVGAFKDESVKAALSLPEDHEPLYIIPIGEPLE